MKDTHNQATPRPWRMTQVSPGVFQIYSDTRNCIAMVSDKTLGHSANKSDAVLIIRAVNSFDAYRDVAEAAKLLAKRVSDRQEDSKLDWTENDFALWLKVTEALAALAKLNS